MPPTVPQVLEDAADYMLVHGRSKDLCDDKREAGCVIWAVSHGAAMDRYVMEAEDLSHWHTLVGRSLRAVAEHLGLPPTGVVGWNASVDDDFVVIDTLKATAKEIRNSGG